MYPNYIPPKAREGDVDFSCNIKTNIFLGGLDQNTFDLYVKLKHDIRELSIVDDLSAVYIDDDQADSLNASLGIKRERDHDNEESKEDFTTPSKRAKTDDLITSDIKSLPNTLKKVKVHHKLP